MRIIVILFLCIFCYSIHDANEKLKAENRLLLDALQEAQAELKVKCK